MTNNAHVASRAANASSVISPVTRQISPLLTVSAAGVTAVGIATGFIRYLGRSPIRESSGPGTSAWGQQLAVAAVACALYGVARWRHGRRFGRGGGCWRAGEQVTAGLDPNFTANAWGGPSYLGAMACHYLDIALIVGASGWLLDKILPQPPQHR